MVCLLITLAQTLVRDSIQKYPRLLGLKILSGSQTNVQTKIIASSKASEVGQPGDVWARSVIEKAGDEIIDAAIEPELAELARIMPELRIGSVAPTYPTDDSHLQRYRMFEEVVALLAWMLAEKC